MTNSIFRCVRNSAKSHISSHMSVPHNKKKKPCSHGMYCREILYLSLDNLSRKFKFDYNLARLTGTLHTDLYLAELLLE